MQNKQSEESKINKTHFWLFIQQTLLLSPLLSATKVNISVAHRTN